MKTMLVRMLGVVVLASLSVIPARANSVSLSLNGSGTVGIISSGSGNLTLCLGGGSPCSNALAASGIGNGDFTGITSFTISSSAPISLTEVSNCVFANASLTGVTFLGGDISGTISSLTVSQTAGQVSSGVASVSGIGTITSVAGLTVNVPFDLAGALNVGVGVDICALPGGGGSGSFAPTPEPGTLALAVSGLLLFGGTVRRRFAI